MGLKFIGKEDFTSIPGLALYLDARFGKTIVSGDVNSWLDLVNSDIFQKAPALTLPPHDLIDFLDFDDLTNTQQRSLQAGNLTRLKFFHDGSPFGYFSIFGWEQGVLATNSRMFTTRTGAGTGANALLGGQQKRLIYQIVENGVLKLGIQTPLDSLPEDQILSVGITRNSLSETNNFKLYINNSIGFQTTNSAVAVGDNFPNTVIGNINSNRYLPSIKLLYDWTGYTSTQVEGFSSRVRALLEIRKSELIYPF